MNKILSWCEKLRHDGSTWLIEPDRLTIPPYYRDYLDKIAFEQHAAHLLDEGYCVVPFLNEKERKYFLESFQQAELTFREYTRDPNDPTKNHEGQLLGTRENPYVLGGFGAYGNPSSFHNQFVRELRRRKCDLIPILGYMLRLAEERGLIKDACKYKVAQLFDRMCKRPKNTMTSKESYHRDLIPLARENDCTIGGWIQLSDDVSYLSCDPKTHVFPCMHSKIKTGFALDKTKDCTKEVPVPPGAILLFFQNMGHCVYSTRRKSDSYRMFSVWLLTTCSTHMMDYKDVIEMQGVPRLASNQKPWMYSPNHGSFWLKDLTIPWSHRNFIPKVLITKKKKDSGDSYQIVQQHMKSLMEYHLPMYPEYATWEKELFRPQQAFVLPDKAVYLFPSLQ